MQRKVIMEREVWRSLIRDTAEEDWQMDGDQTHNSLVHQVDYFKKILAQKPIGITVTLYANYVSDQIKAYDESVEKYSLCIINREFTSDRRG